jgi:hypothetical protein
MTKERACGRPAFRLDFLVRIGARPTNWHGLDMLISLKCIGNPGRWKLDCLVDDVANCNRQLLMKQLASKCISENSASSCHAIAFGESIRRTPAPFLRSESPTSTNQGRHKEARPLTLNSGPPAQNMSPNGVDGARTQHERHRSATFLHSIIWNDDNGDVGAMSDLGFN